MEQTLQQNTVTSAHRFDRYFYFYMAIACAVIAFAGFAPTYWIPLLSGKLNAHPIIHLHGAIFFAWSLFLVHQTWLATSGRIRSHRANGLIGVSLATAMSSQPEDFHLRLLPEPCMTLSSHTAPDVRPLP